MKERGDKWGTASLGELDDLALFCCSGMYPGGAIGSLVLRMRFGCSVTVCSTPLSFC